MRVVPSMCASGSKCAAFSLFLTAAASSSAPSRFVILMRTSLPFHWFPPSTVDRVRSWTRRRGSSVLMSAIILSSIFPIRRVPYFLRHAFSKPRPVSILRTIVRPSLSFEVAAPSVALRGSGSAVALALLLRAARSMLALREVQAERVAGDAGAPASAIQASSKSSCFRN